MSLLHIYRFLLRIFVSSTSPSSARVTQRERAGKDSGGGGVTTGEKGLRRGKWVTRVDGREVPDSGKREIDKGARSQ